MLIAHSCYCNVFVQVFKNDQSSNFCKITYNSVFQFCHQLIARHKNVKLVICQMYSNPISSQRSNDSHLIVKVENIRNTLPTKSIGTILYHHMILTLVPIQSVMFGGTQVWFWQGRAAMEFENRPIRFLKEN